MNREQLRKMVYNSLFDNLRLYEGIKQDAVSAALDIVENPYDNKLTQLLKDLGIDLEEMAKGKNKDLDAIEKKLDEKEKEILKKELEDKLVKLDKDKLDQVAATAKKSAKLKKKFDKFQSQKQKGKDFVKNLKDRGDLKKLAKVKVKNPKTGRTIQATSALKKGHPAYKQAKAKIKSALKEANRGKVFKAAKKGSFPATIVVVQNGKVIHQEKVSTPGAAPAKFNVMQEKYPKALIHLEDTTGKRLFSEGKINEAIILPAEKSLAKKLLKTKFTKKQNWSNYRYERGFVDNWREKTGSKIYRVPEFKAQFGVYPNGKVAFKYVESDSTNKAERETIFYNKPEDITEGKLKEATSLWKHFDAKMKLQDEIMDLEYDMKMINKDLGQLHRDMEQEAEPAGGKIADRYGKQIDKKEKEYKKKKAEFKKLMAKLDKMEMY